MSEEKTNKQLDQALDTFIEGAGKISSALLGMVNKVGGQIYALLFLSSKPLSLDEIAEHLHVSKSNVSINIRILEEIHLVRKVWIKGSRRDYYSAERIYPKKIIKDFLEKIHRTMQDAISTIEKTRTQITEAKTGAKTAEKVRAAFMLDQLNLIGLFYYTAIQFFEDFFTGKPVDIEILRRTIMSPENLQNHIEK